MKKIINHQWKRWLALVIIMMTTVLLFSSQNNITKVSAQEEIPITIYLFWGEGCPHCEAEMEFLTNLQKKYPTLQLEFFEIYYEPENLALLKEFSAAYDFEPRGVPVAFIGNDYFVGYGGDLGSHFETMIQEFLAEGYYPDPMAKVQPEEAEPQATPIPTESQPEIEESNIINIPLIGSVDLSNHSILASTIIIAAVDGVNPCSLWVLSVLMALSLHTGSRKKVLLIGGVFLSITALIYAFFILGLFSVLTIASITGWVQIVVALVAGIFALINIKDYFWYKEGVSLTIADDKKPGIFKKMRNVVNASDSFWGTISATIVLAAGVSLVEFSCTAGLPMVWTNLLTSQAVGGWEFILLLFVYMLIYLLIEIVTFIPAAMSLKSRRFEEKSGRVLKLVGGMLMLTLSIVMVFNPAIMNEIGTTLLVFVIALGVTGLVLLLHKKVLPSLDIYIGSDQKPQLKRKRER
ncbi:MAG: thioredoxin family protein [Anaerolineaceae bacterium]|nr:thioredoxin family protein [Anaerolineaceae bacterium]